MILRSLVPFAISAILLVSGCGDDPAATPGDAGVPAPDAATSDAGDPRDDAGATRDAAPLPDDAATEDAGPALDASSPDAGTPGDAGASAFRFTSSAFVDGGTLPAEFTCDGVGHSPPLAWTSPPEGTVEFALLMTTLARDGLKWNWVLFHIPAGTTSLDVASLGVGTAGLTSDGPALAYSPPCSAGPGPKEYTFTLYALSAVPTLPAAARDVTGMVLTDAIAPITLASRSITVTYTRP